MSSRLSSRPASSRTPESPTPPTPPRPFELLALVLVVGLALLATGLTVANAEQGPTLRTSTLDVARATTVAGQRWNLDLDQAVDVAATTVTLTPDVPHRTEVSDRRVSVRLDRPLDVGTAYRLTVDTRAPGSGTRSLISQSVTTPPATTLLLERPARFGSGGSDTVWRTDVAGGAQTPVFRGPNIQETAYAAPYLLVVEQSSDAARNATVRVVETGDDGDSKPGTGRVVLEGPAVAQAHASGPGGLFGLVAITSDDGGFSSRLTVLDPKTGRTGTVDGPDAKPFDPLGWRFVPGTTQLVVQGADGQLWLADPWNRTPPRPLGGHTALEDFVPGTRQLVVLDAGRRRALDLGTGRADPLADPPAVPGSTVYESWPAADDARRATVYSSPGADPSAPQLALRVGAEEAPAWTAPPGATLGRVCPSPNGQFLALEVVPADAPGDDYRAAPGSLGTRTTVVDLATRRPTGDAAGAASTWCN